MDGQRVEEGRGGSGAVTFDLVFLAEGGFVQSKHLKCVKIRIHTTLRLGMASNQRICSIVEIV